MSLATQAAKKILDTRDQQPLQECPTCGATLCAHLVCRVCGTCEPCDAVQSETLHGLRP